MHLDRITEKKIQKDNSIIVFLIYQQFQRAQISFQHIESLKSSCKKKIKLIL